MAYEQNITETPNFIVKTSAYEGPFELILDLIEKRKLLVNELSLTAITNDFVMHVRAQKTFPLEETTNFIGIAAILLLIKSKSLIPQFNLSEEEEEDVGELERRLQQYKRVKDATREVRARLFCAPLFARKTPIPEPIFSPGSNLTQNILSETLFILLKNQEHQEEQLPETRVQKTASLEETINILSQCVRSSLTLSFREFSGFAKKEKIQVVVSFLALLELVKQGAVGTEQYDRYGDIRITNMRSDTPSYNTQ